MSLLASELSRPLPLALVIDGSLMLRPWNMSHTQRVVDINLSNMRIYSRTYATKQRIPEVYFFLFLGLGECAATPNKSNFCFLSFLLLALRVDLLTTLVGVSSNL
jgi:hypothetical protein